MFADGVAGMIDRKRQEEIMRLVISKAYEAAARGDSPFAAALVDYRGDIVAMSNNTAHTQHTVTTVELNILRIMSQEHGIRDLSNFSLFTNAEPYSGGMIYMLRAGVRHFYYGAPTELDAHIQLHPLTAEIVRHTPEKVYIYSDVLTKECIEGIRRGRFIQREMLLNS